MGQDDVARFQERDQRKLEERLAKGRAKEEEERRKEKRLAKLKSQVRGGILSCISLRQLIKKTD